MDALLLFYLSVLCVLAFDPGTGTCKHRVTIRFHGLDRFIDGVDLRLRSGLILGFYREEPKTLEREGSNQHMASMQCSSKDYDMTS